MRLPVLPLVILSLSCAGPATPAEPPAATTPATPPPAPPPTTAAASAPAPDASTLLADLCPAGHVANGACDVCFDAPDQQGSWTVDPPIPGSFTASGAPEAVAWVSSPDCLGHADNFGAAVLVRYDGAHWKEVRSQLGWQLIRCATVHGADARDRLACLGGGTFQGITVTVMSLLDLGVDPPTQDVLARTTDQCQLPVVAAEFDDPVANAGSLTMGLTVHRGTACATPGPAEKSTLSWALVTGKPPEPSADTTALLAQLPEP